MSRRAVCQHSVALAGAGTLAASGDMRLVLALGDLRVGADMLGRLDCLIGGGALDLDGPALVVTITP